MSTVTELVTEGYRQDNIRGAGQPIPAVEVTEGIAKLNSLLWSLFGHELGEHMREWRVPDPQRSASVAARWPQGPAADDLPSTVYLYAPSNARIMDKVTAATTVYFPEKPSDGARMGYSDVGSTAVMTLHGNGRPIGTQTSLAVRATVTMTIASPAVVTWTSHGRVAGDPVVFTTTDTLATGVTAGTTYYVISEGLTASAFEFAATPGGTAVNTSGSQAGTHTGAIPDGTEWLYRADLGRWKVLRTLVAADTPPLPAQFDDFLVCALSIALCPRHGKVPAAPTVAIYKDGMSRLKARFRQETPWIGGADEMMGSTQLAFNPLE